MFDIGWGELVVIGAVALVVIGPKELPGVLRTVGGAVGKIRRMAAEFQGQFRRRCAKPRCAEARKDRRRARTTASARPSFNPIQTIRDEIRNAVEGTNPASTSSTTASEPTIAVPLPPPVPDLTPEQIRRRLRARRTGGRGCRAGKERSALRKPPAEAAPLQAAGDGAAPTAAPVAPVALQSRRSEAATPGQAETQDGQKARAPVASDARGRRRMTPARTSRPRRRR